MLLPASPLWCVWFWLWFASWLIVGKMVGLEEIPMLLQDDGDARGCHPLVEGIA
jgi:hypothetical protein